MAGEDNNSRRDTPPASASPGSGEGREQPEERDFGDSAGYGTGGSAIDFHEVGDEDGNPVKGKRNPLDDVMDTKEGGPSTGSPGSS